jgi:hypothetical protein
VRSVWTLRLRLSISTILLPSWRSGGKEVVTHESEEFLNFQTKQQLSDICVVVSYHAPCVRKKWLRSCEVRTREGGSRRFSAYQLLIAQSPGRFVLSPSGFHGSTVAAPIPSAVDAFFGASRLILYPQYNTDTKEKFEVYLPIASALEVFGQQPEGLLSKHTQSTYERQMYFYVFLCGFLCFLVWVSIDIPKESPHKVVRDVASYASNSTGLSKVSCRQGRRSSSWNQQYAHSQQFRSICDMLWIRIASFRIISTGEVYCTAWAHAYGDMVCAPEYIHICFRV